ncbi:hypothetical protein F5888DRAFT_1720832 [Russula emetica]|nr:hypothetical protein F5888DRAFT_1720832 [Russula emetica]
MAEMMHIHINAFQLPTSSLALLLTFYFPGYWIVRVSFSFNCYWLKIYNLPPIFSPSYFLWTLYSFLSF